MQPQNSSSAGFCVYVIGLKPEVLASKKFRLANPDYREGKPCYYVGYSSLSPEDRAEQHRTAGRSAKGTRLYNGFAFRFFDGLRPSKFNVIPRFTDKESARKAEVLLAERLRKRGCAVWQK